MSGSARWIKKLERQEAWIEREADKVLADEHKADQMLGGVRNAQPAQTPDPQALAATLADLQAQMAALEQQTKVAQMEKEAAELQSKVQSTQATIELVSKPGPRPARHAEDGCSRKSYEPLTDLVAARQDALNMAAPRSPLATTGPTGR